MHLGEVLDDREPEPETTVPTGGRGIPLQEPLENMRQQFRRDPLAIVTDFDFRAVGNSVQRHFHDAVATGEFDGVDHQIPHDLVEPRAIAVHVGIGVADRREVDALGIRSGARRSDDLVDQRHEVDGIHLERQLAGHNTTDVEQIVNHLSLTS